MTSETRDNWQDEATCLGFCKAGRQGAQARRLGRPKSFESSACGFIVSLGVKLSVP